MSASTDFQNMRASLEQEIEKLQQLERDRTRSLTNRQQLESQLTENNMVKEELDRLESGAAVYKLVGPVLVRQELEEARENVHKRIEYIGTEIKRVETTLDDLLTSVDKQKRLCEEKQMGLREFMMASNKKP